MKMKPNQELTFGDFIAAAHQIWGAGKAEQMVRLALLTRLVVFRAHPYSLISFTEGESHE
jgi:hypothetical protein